MITSEQERLVKNVLNDIGARFMMAAQKTLDKNYWREYPLMKEFL
jgi:hypothetical protein